MSLLQTFRGYGYSATNYIFGQGFANRLFGSKQLLNRNTSVQPVVFGGPATYPDPNALRFIQDGFSANATVYTIISIVARKFGSLPRYVYKVNEQKAMRQYRQLLKQGRFKLHDLLELEKKAFDETVIEDGPFAELLEAPNEYQGQDSFFELACLFYLLIGETFVWKNRGDIDGMDDDQADKMEVLEMYIIPSQYVELIPDPDNVWGIVGYYFVVNGQRIFLRKNDVVHWRRPNPNFDAITRVHLRGFSPLNPGNKLITQDNAATDATVAMHQNDGAKGVLYNKSLDQLDTTQQSQLRTVVDRKVNNRDIKGAVATLQGDWGFIDLSMSSVDMELVEGQEAVFVRICNLIGVNPMMFLANSTYQNIQQARKDLVTSLVLPLACSFRDELNRSFKNDFKLGKQTTHDVDVSQLPELQNDMADLVQSLSQAWWLTPNDRRKAMNEEPSDDPNMDKVWVPQGLQPMEDAAMTDINNSFTDGPNSDQGAGGKGNTDPSTKQPGDKGGLPQEDQGKAKRA